jgi:hypothetical protein
MAPTGPCAAQAAGNPCSRHSGHFWWQGPSWCSVTVRVWKYLGWYLGLCGTQWWVLLLADELLSKVGIKGLRNRHVAAVVARPVCRQPCMITADTARRLLTVAIQHIALVAIVGAQPCVCVRCPYIPIQPVWAQKNTMHMACGRCNRS